MIIECPHCYTRVMPGPEGECPACRKNTRDTAGTDPAKTAMSIPNQASLPPVCCECGRPTDRYVKVTRSVRVQGAAEGSGGTLASIGLWLLGGFTIFASSGHSRGTSGDVIVIHMPQCPLCGAEGPPSPKSVNAEELRMTFVVHKVFKEKAVKSSA